MNSEKIERIAVRAVEDYISKCPQLEAVYQLNDISPIGDGKINVYTEDYHLSENLISRIPLQINGITQSRATSFRIKREYIEAYKVDKGCIFFAVQVDDNGIPSRILYNMLSLMDIDILLHQQNAQTIKINLKPTPDNPHDFQVEVIKFVELRNAGFDTKGLDSLKEDCEKLRDYLPSINSSQRDYLKTLLDKTKYFIVGTTFDWSEKFIQNIQGILEVAQNNSIEDYILLKDIATKLALFLQEQKIYDLAERYLKVAENYSRALVELHPESIEVLTESRRNLVELYYKKTIDADDIEEAYSLSLCETEPTKYLKRLAKEYYILAENLEKKKRHRKAEKNYINALNIYLLLADANEKSFIKVIFCILDKLYEIHKNLRGFIEAERDIGEAMVLCEKIANTESTYYQTVQANFIAKSAYIKRTRKMYPDAVKEYVKSIELYDALNKKNNNKQMKEKAHVLVSLADLYSEMGEKDNATEQFHEALKIYNNLGEKHLDITASKAKTLFKLANHYALYNYKEEAEIKKNKALELQKELANSDECASYEAETLIALARLYLKEEPDIAAQRYEEALVRLSELVNKDEEANIYILMHFLNDSKVINNIFSTSNQAKEIFDTVESNYRKFFNVCKDLEENNKDIYKEEIAVVLNSLADLYYCFRDYDTAEKEYTKVLEMRREIAKDKLDKNIDVAYTLIDLGKLQSSRSRPMEAEPYYNEALNIFLDNTKGDCNISDEEIAALHNDLGKLYITLKRYSEAENHFHEASEIYRKLTTKNPERFNLDLAETLENIALLLSKDNKRLEDAVISTRVARDFYIKLANESPTIENLCAEKIQQLTTTLGALNQKRKKSSYYIERSAVRAVEDYIDNFPKLESLIQSNDKTPVWDGDIIIYNSEAEHTVESYYARVPVQVKGTTNSENDSYRIEREYIIAYEAERGCVFFMVQEENDSYKPIRILYAMLSMEDVQALLQRQTKTIKIDLQEIPADRSVFEQELIRFAEKRKGEKLDNPAPKEIASLVEQFKEIEKHLDEIQDKGDRIALQAYIKAIKELKDGGTIGWRDSFVFLSGRALDLAIQHIKVYDFLPLQQDLGKYLYEQKYYHQAEDYYVKSLMECRERAKDNHSYIQHVATTLNNLANLHSDLNQYEIADAEYKELLEIRLEMAESNPDAYLPDVATTLNNLANMHRNLNRYEIAEAEFRESLVIRQELAKSNPDAFLPDVATTLNNLANLHSDLNKLEIAEAEFWESLEIRREMAKSNPDAYLPDVATTLNNLAVLNRNLNRYEIAEAGYQESLEICREMAKSNPVAYLPDVATTLNNLAVLHMNLNRYENAEAEYQESLEIRREMAKSNPDAYLPDVATTLNNLANMHRNLNRYENAEAEYQESLEIRREMAKSNPDAYLPYVATTLNNLANLHSDLNKLENAEAEYQESLEIRRELAKSNPVAYLPDVATTLNNLANLHSDLNKLENAEAEYQESLDIRQELAKSNPDAYLPDVAMTLFNLAVLRISKHSKNDAKKACEEALEIYKAIAKKAPQKWNKYVNDTQQLLDTIYEYGL